MKTIKKWWAMRRKEGRFMRVCALIFSVLVSSGAAAQDTPRIVSTSLCGDTYVLDMVPRQHIAALSWQVGDALSLAPDDLRNGPKAWDDGERLLALNPTHIIFGPGEGLAAKTLLEKRGIASVQLKWADDFTTITDNRKALTDLFGYNLAITDSAYASGEIFINPPDVLYLSRAGGTAGPGTYVDAAISAAGGVNMIKTKGWHTPDPEELVSLTPDLIITSFFEQGYESVNAQGTRHALLQDKLATTPSVNVPGALWPCAGPRLDEATEIIADAIESLTR